MKTMIVERITAIEKSADVVVLDCISFSAISERLR